MSDARPASARAEGDRLVSVLMPAHNHERYVADAIVSVVEQTHRPLELLVIDDGSTDGTAAVCRKLAEEHDVIRFESRSNAGVGATVNRLIARAKGDYLAFLASDDAFEPDKLSRQVAVLDREPSLGAVFSHVHEMDPFGNLRDDWSKRSQFNLRWEDDAALAATMMTGNRLCATTCLIRADLAARIGPFDEQLQFVQDYDYWMRLLIASKIKVLDERLTRYRRHEANLSKVDPAGSCAQTCEVVRRHVPDMLARYPETFVQIGAIYRGIVTLAHRALDWETAEIFLAELCEWFGKGDNERTQHIACLLQLGRCDEAQRIADELLGRRLQLSPEVFEAVTRLNACIGELRTAQAARR